MDYYNPPITQQILDEKRYDLSIETDFKTKIVDDQQSLSESPTSTTATATTTNEDDELEYYVNRATEVEETGPREESVQKVRKFFGEPLVDCHSGIGEPVGGDQENNEEEEEVADAEAEVANARKSALRDYADDAVYKLLSGFFTLGLLSVFIIVHLVDILMPQRFRGNQL